MQHLVNKQCCYYFQIGKSLPLSIQVAGYKNFTYKKFSNKKSKTPYPYKNKNHFDSNNKNNNNNVSGYRGRVDSAKIGLKVEKPVVTRFPLSVAVSECVNRWFNDTLKEATNGDTSMQLLVGQMYNSGYGVCKDLEKGRAWITRASKTRSSAWRVSNKQPGYNASDSDSEDSKDVRS